MDKKQPIFTASADAQILYAALRDHAHEAPTAVISYASLTAAIQRDVQNGARSVLNTARRMVLNDEGLVFETVRGVGLKLVPHDELHKVASSARRKAGRVASRGLRKLQTADFANMGPDARLRSVAEATVLQVQAHAAKQTTVKRLEAKLLPDQTLMPLKSATLALFDD